ncbi:hypothetical protein LTR37_014520 [Vermiconidia calcicola]|uniref:Uncharacterized protein n=1 Tax=Vermiconidia calcicola TaxID=1690605 RepID=A0ACC3MTA3_9PEZI|nr:hypothetical protein LTR37_014520 [Vermiconidia calcicola]
MEPNQSRSNSQESLSWSQQAELAEVIGARTSSDDLIAMGRRYVRRLDSANLARYPEGYVFINTLANGEEYPVILLTPPDLVAVQRADGTWYRRTRGERATDAPEPYTLEHYMNYLEANHLPPWFLRPEHTRILNLPAESQRLGLTDNLPTPTPFPPSDYLVGRYPTEPEYLRPNLRGEGVTYAYDATMWELRRLARRFPAALEAALRGNYRIYVTPAGHIFIRENTELLPNELLLNPGEGRWDRETQKNMRSSYERENPPATYQMELASPATAASSEIVTANRPAEIAAATANGGYPDIGQLPHGRGRFEWLNEEVDQQLARALNYANPIEVVVAEESGAFDNVPLNNRPRVVFYPNRQYFNLTHQPRGDGQWRYFTTRGDGSAQTLAHMNHGGQHPETLDIPRPTASQLFQLRRRMQARLARGEIDRDTTMDSEIVWVPAGDMPDDTSDAGAESEHEPTPVDPVDDQNSDIIDSDSRLRHSPLNRGENDQTGTPGARNYQTRQIGDKKYTLDRSRSHVGPAEPHKSWVVTKNGEWFQYKKYHLIDWTNKDSVEKLNKWREQACKRGEWPKKRKDDRDTYTDEQKEYLFVLIKANSGGRPKLSMAKLTRRFNQQFSNQRGEMGITGIYDRLRGQWRANNGERSERRPRGQNKKEEAARKRKRDEMEDDEDQEGEGDGEGESGDEYGDEE